MLRSTLVGVAAALTLLVLVASAGAADPVRGAIRAGVFRADDGGAVYLSAVGNAAYAFAAYVTVNSDSNRPKQSLGQVLQSAFDAALR